MDGLGARSASREAPTWQVTVWSVLCFFEQWIVSGWPIMVPLPLGDNNTDYLQLQESGKADQPVVRSK